MAQRLPDHHPHIVVTYSASERKMRVYCSFWYLLPYRADWVGEQGEAVDPNFAASYELPYHLWPYECYYATCVETEGDPGDPGGGNAFTVYYGLTSVPDII